MIRVGAVVTSEAKYASWNAAHAAEVRRQRFARLDRGECWCGCGDLRYCPQEAKRITDNFYRGLGPQLVWAVQS